MPNDSTKIDYTRNMFAQYRSTITLLLVSFVRPRHFAPLGSDLFAEGQSALTVLTLCVVWWIFTPVPLPVTSMVGLALLPFLNALTVGEAFALFGNQAVFFVIGVFIVASVMLQSGISARFSISGLRLAAKSEAWLCNSILFLSFALCAVIVSHAVAALMFPIVLGIIQSLNLPHRSRLSRRLLLSMAWGTVCGSNIGLLSSARAALALELLTVFERPHLYLCPALAWWTILWLRRHLRLGLC